jgi:peptidyl-prolyl cis-trans isomerase D
MSKNEKKLSILKDTAKAKAEKHKKRQNNLMAGTVVILAITIISFVLVPALAGSAGGGGSFVFGRYGNTPITFEQGNYFAQQVESINNMYRDSLGENSNVEFLRQLIWRSAFTKTVVRTAVLDEIQSAGAGVSSRKIDRSIVNSGIFDVNGEFDEESYMNTSSARIKEIRDSMSEDLKVQLYYGDTMDNLQRSEKELDFLLSMGSIEKNFSYAVYPYSSYPAEKVSEYGKENAKLFQKLNLNRITVTTSEKDALDILNRLDGGSSFEEVATNMSQDSFAENGGSLGEVYYYNLLTYLSEEQTDEVFSLTQDSVSGLISTDNSYYIFQAAGSPIQLDTEDTEAIATIRAYMEQEEIGLIEDYLVGQAEALAAVSQSSDLTTVAAEQGVETGETGYIAPVYGNIPFITNGPGNKSGNSLLSSLAFSDDFFQKAFGLKTSGELSEPVILDRSVILFSLKGEKEGAGYPEEYRDYIKNYQLKNALNQYKESQIQAVFLDSDKLKDNFNATFNRIFAQS